METENNKPTAENDKANNESRPSVWERFMTIYTCLLPIVVWVVIVCHFVIHKPMWCEHFGIFIPLPIYLPCSLYLLSVYISLFLVPHIFLGILLYDYYKHKRTIKKRLLNIRDNPRNNTLSRVCTQFHDSFIGEIIHIFLYFVMLGILFLLHILYMENSNSYGGLAGIAIAMDYAALNYIVPVVLALIFLYVLIRRLSIYYARRIRKYKRQKDKRKEALERIRNNRQDNPPLPPEE